MGSACRPVRSGPRRAVPADLCVSPGRWRHRLDRIGRTIAALSLGRQAAHAPGYGGKGPGISDGLADRPGDRCRWRGLGLQSSWADSGRPRQQAGACVRRARRTSQFAPAGGHAGAGKHGADPGRHIRRHRGVRSGHDASESAPTAAVDRTCQPATRRARTGCHRQGAAASAGRRSRPAYRGAHAHVYQSRIHQLPLPPQWLRSGLDRRGLHRRTVVFAPALRALHAGSAGAYCRWHLVGQPDITFSGVAAMVAVAVGFKPAGLADGVRGRRRHLVVPPSAAAPECLAAGRAQTGAGRTGVFGQDAFSGDAGSRSAYADDGCVGHERIAAQDHAGPHAAQLHRVDPSCGRASVAAGQRCAGSGAHRIGPA